MTFVSAIGAVPYGDRCACQTPLSGQRWPVVAVVPMGLRVRVNMGIYSGSSLQNCKSKSKPSALWCEDEHLYRVGIGLLLHPFSTRRRGRYSGPAFLHHNYISS
jgi:hypothetical protein